MRLYVAGVAATIFVVVACAPTLEELDVGDCFDAPETGMQVRSLVPLSCGEDHTAEVVAVLMADVDASPNPAEDALSRCAEGFENYVGSAYWDSRYDVYALTPSADAWEDGERRVICYAVNPSGALLEGSIEGTYD